MAGTWEAAAAETLLFRRLGYSQNQSNYLGGQQPQDPLTARSLKAFRTSQDAWEAAAAGVFAFQKVRKPFKTNQGTWEAAAAGKSRQCTDSGLLCGRALRRFWYMCSQMKGVKGAITCPHAGAGQCRGQFAHRVQDIGRTSALVLADLS